MTDRDNAVAELDEPRIQCGHCRFSAPLRGTWSWEDGRLVFRADPDPQPGRGPDLASCGECGARFVAVHREWPGDAPEETAALAAGHAAGVAVQRAARDG